MCQKQILWRKTYWSDISRLIGEEGKRHYVLMKDFYTYVYDHILHFGRNIFCCYCLQAFSTEKNIKMSC